MIDLNTEINLVWYLYAERSFQNEPAVVFPGSYDR